MAFESFEVAVPPPAEKSLERFRAAAVVLYLFSGLTSLGDNFVMLFIVVTLLSAMDFWFVKNISGRILVGLRWLHQVQEDGNSVWVYSSKPEQSNPVVASESVLFWGVLYVTPLVWVFLCISNILSKNLIICVVPLVLTTANLIGYWKCQSDANKKLASFIIQNTLMPKI